MKQRNYSMWVLTFSLSLFAHTLLFTASDLEKTKDETTLAYVLMDRKSSYIVEEENSRELRHPASLTKIATALYIYEASGASLEGIVKAQKSALKEATAALKEKNAYTLPPYLLEPDGSSISIQEGETFSLSDLMHALLIRSSNDSANVLSQHVSGSIPRFMKDLQNYLHEKGYQQSHFLNPHGLHHPQHVSTALELAHLARDLLEHPYLARIVALKEYTIEATNLSNERKIYQTNALLRRGELYYHNAYGIKNGYHKKAGYNIAAAALSNDSQRDLICVILGGMDKKQCYQKAKDLFEKAFQEKKETFHFAEVDQEFILELPKEKATLKAALKKNLSHSIYPSMKDAMNLRVEWDKTKFPIKTGQLVAKLLLLDENNNVVKEEGLYAKKQLYSLKVRRILLGICLFFLILILRKLSSFFF